MEIKTEAPWIKSSSSCKDNVLWLTPSHKAIIEQISCQCLECMDRPLGLPLPPKTNLKKKTEKREETAFWLGFNGKLSGMVYWVRNTRVICVLTLKSVFCGHWMAKPLNSKKFKTLWIVTWWIYNTFMMNLANMGVGEQQLTWSNIKLLVKWLYFQQ